MSGKPPQELAPARVVITVRHAGQPVADAELLALFPNRIWKQAVIGLHTGHLSMSVFAAAEGFAAQVESGWIPAQGPLTQELNRQPGGGSVIFNEATGRIPGLTGRLNPKRDTHDRTYLYASNIAINQGRQQPVFFSWARNCVGPTPTAERLWCGSSTSSDVPRWWSTGLCLRFDPGLSGQSASDLPDSVWRVMAERASSPQ